MCGLITVVASFLATNLISRLFKNFDKVIGADSLDILLYLSDAKERNISNLRKSENFAFLCKTWHVTNYYKYL